MEQKPKLTEGTLVLPYSRSAPILVLKNLGANVNRRDLIVRVRMHSSGLWYADVDSSADGQPKDPVRARQHGCVLFVDRTLKVGEALRVTRVSSTGNSATGVIINLPDGVRYPVDMDAKALYNAQ